MAAVLAVIGVAAALPHDDRIRTTSGMVKAASLIQNRITNIVSPTMKGFFGAKASRFHDLPEYLVGVMANVPSTVVSAGTELEFECAHTTADNPYKMCVAYIFMYGCPPCMEQDGDGLPAKLLARGWEKVSCQGSFSFAPGSHRHPFNVYRVSIPAGSSEFVAIDADLNYAFFALDNRSQKCSGQKLPETCAADPFGRACYWDSAAEECKPVACPHSPAASVPRPHSQTGPWQPRCSVCPNTDPARV